MQRHNSIKNRAAQLFCALLILPALAFSAFAQTGTATVRGSVQDQQGNAIAGANVTLRNDEKNFIRTQTTAESGGYVFTAVPPGVYRIETEAAGFKKLWYQMCGL